MAVPMNGVVKIELVSITCPTCESEIAEPNSGALNFTIWELCQNQKLKCQCGEVVKVPKKIEKLKENLRL